jgi:hypothetical protein
MTAAPLERLSLRAVLTATFEVFRRDLLVLMALAFAVRGAGVVAEGWLQALLHADIAARSTAAIIPWIAGFIPFALADGAIVWVALRRLSGSPLPMDGVRGLIRTVGVVLAVDLVENTPDILQLFAPDSLNQTFGPGYDIGVSILGALWLSLWLPALAVAVLERASGPTSLERSLNLTLGHRWTLAALCLALQALILGVSLFVGVALASSGLGGLPGWLVEFASLPVWAFSSVTQATVYWELVRLKTGLAPSAAASVFD